MVIDAEPEKKEDKPKLKRKIAKVKKLEYFML